MDQAFLAELKAEKNAEINQSINQLVIFQPISQLTNQLIDRSRSVGFSVVSHSVGQSNKRMI